VREKFKRSLRELALESKAHILVVGGIPCSGKTTFIGGITSSLSQSAQALVIDLQNIRDRSIVTSSDTLIELYRRLGLPPPDEPNTIAIPGLIFSSWQKLYVYYLWLEELCRPHIFNELVDRGKYFPLWIFELVTPIDSMWDIGDLWIKMCPPSRLIDTRIVERESICLANAELRHSVYEQLAATIPSSRQPYIIQDKNNSIKTVKVKNLLEELGWV
jgi:hypothetical protein